MHRLSESANEIAFSEAELQIPNGAWTWFTDERAIVDTHGSHGPRLLVGVVSAEDGPGGGDINVLWRDNGSDETGCFCLHESLEQDDHNAPALFVRPDGRYLAMYTRHGSDPYTRWRVSTMPHDPTRWEPERSLDNGAGTTYSNVYRLADDADGSGRTYCFTRTVNWDPNILVSTDQGTTWSYSGRLLKGGGDGQRPYVRYCEGGGRIHFTTTEHHPRDHNNGVYHGYVQDGKLFDSTGSVLSDAVLDGGGDVPNPSDLTTVFEPGSTNHGVRLTRAWTIDTSVDADGRPVTIFQTRADDDPADHRFFYARLDGEWQMHHLAKAGPGLYDDERDYTGLATIDPDNADRIVISTPIDPRDGAPLDYHELFAGVTGDCGSTWEWEPLTPGASSDSLRPLIPSSDMDGMRVIWMRGEYRTFRWWDTQIVGRIYRY